VRGRCGLAFPDVGVLGHPGLPVALVLAATAAGAAGCREPAIRFGHSVIGPDEAGRSAAAGSGFALGDPRLGADHSVGAHDRALAGGEPHVLADQAPVSQTAPDAAADTWLAGLPRKGTGHAGGCAPAGDADRVRGLAAESRLAARSRDDGLARLGNGADGLRLGRDTVAGSATATRQAAGSATARQADGNSPARQATARQATAARYACWAAREAARAGDRAAAGRKAGEMRG
jgi:hypothetical protein